MTATAYVIASHPDAWPVLVVFAAVAMLVSGGVMLIAFDKDYGMEVMLVGLFFLVFGGIAGFVTVAGNVGDGMQECVDRGGRVIRLQRDDLCEVTP